MAPSYAAVCAKALAARRLRVCCETSPEASSSASTVA
jgi:hypothetical protein